MRDHSHEPRTWYITIFVQNYLLYDGTNAFFQIPLCFSFTANERVFEEQTNPISFPALCRKMELKSVFATKLASEKDSTQRQNKPPNLPCPRRAGPTETCCARDRGGGPGAGALGRQGAAAPCRADCAY